MDLGTYKSDPGGRAEPGQARCKRCVLPQTARGVQFDGKGVCTVCLAAERQTKTCTDYDVDAFEGTLETIRDDGRGRDYDCVVGVSGGRDSCYLAHLLTYKHKLRALAAYYRTPFTPETTHENVQNLSRKTGVPLVEMRMSQQAHARFARRFLLRWRQRPTVSGATIICAPCKLVNREALRISHQCRVRAYIGGGTRHERFQFGTPNAASGRKKHSFWNQAKRNLGMMRHGVRVLREAPGVVVNPFLVAKAALLYINPHTPYLRLRYPKIRRIEYFQHARWDEQECLAALDDIGWRLPPGCYSYWRSDCAMAEVKNWMFRHTAGVSYVEAMYANQVRDGVMTREEALGRIETEARVSWPRLEQASKVLEVPLSFFRQRLAGARMPAEAPSAEQAGVGKQSRPIEGAAARV